MSSISCCWFILSSICVIWFTSVYISFTNWEERTRHESARRAAAQAAYEALSQASARALAPAASPATARAPRISAQIPSQASSLEDFLPQYTATADPTGPPPPPQGSPPEYSKIDPITGIDHAALKHAKWLKEKRVVLKGSFASPFTGGTITNKA